MSIGVLTRLRGKLGALVRALEQRFPAVHNHGEQARLVQTVGSLVDRKDARILDVGCGFGGNMLALGNAGYVNVVGVDVNRETVAANAAKGLACVHADSFDDTGFDAVIMSHVIEHLQPDALKAFLDRYLDLLLPGGVLIVSAPLIWDGFYQDFDHVKPYYPKGLLSVFEQSGAQVQYYGRNRLTLVGAPWVRRMPLLVSGYKYFLLQSFGPLERLGQLGLNVLFYWSEGRIGRPNGWMCAFRRE